MISYAKPSRILINRHRMPMATGPLFAKLEQCKRKIRVVQGGGDAAKTVTILQRLAVKAIQNKGYQITVVGIDVPNLKRGALRAFKRYVANSPQIAPYIQFFNKSDREYHFMNGSVISFVSFDDAEDARGAEHDIVFMNEANLMSYDLFWELQRKTRQEFIIDYNPVFAFWCHAKLIHGGEAQFADKVQLFIVDHRHNPFLTDDEHEAYEKISDPERFRVYARGMTGQLKGQIFRFKKVDQVPVRMAVDKNGKLILDNDGKQVYESLPFGFGIDIGYTTDKTAIVKVWMDGKDHYYQELLYKSNDEIQDEINEKGLTSADGRPLTIEGYIKKILIANGMTTSTMVWGDHDKNMSTKLRRIGVPYRMAKKGPNSVVASISSVKRYNGFMFKSPTIEEEIKKYIWQTAVDILTGNEVSTGEPVEDVPDHLIAAIRYYEHSYSMRFAA